jgi:hypothetical protein
MVIALQSRFRHGHPQMLRAIPPSRGVGRPARKIEEPDYWIISVWEKRITTVTAIAVLLVTVCPNCSPCGGARQVDIEVLQVDGRRIKTGPRFRTSVDTVGRSSRRDVAGRNLDLSGMPADVPETLPGCGMLFVPTFPGAGPASAIADGNKLSCFGCRRQPKH